mmetsp:Transcript_6348/g.13851  ORF Transcript_6348/g.13851 Transcript_6348/m.13851 type:complete len:237 (-) Transcript_6348:341-1051(-)
MSNGMGHVELARLERVRLGVGRDVKVPRNSVDEHDPAHQAALAALDGDLGVARLHGPGVVVVVDIVVDKLLEGLVRAVADVALVRDRGVVAVDPDRWECVYMLVLAQFPTRPCAISLAHDNVSRMRSLHHIEVGLFPNGLQSPAPWAPWSIEVDHDQLPRGGELFEVLLAEFRRHLRYVRDVDRLRLCVLNRFRNVCRASKLLATNANPGLLDVGRDILQVRAHNVGNVNAREPAR